MGALLDTTVAACVHTRKRTAANERNNFTKSALKRIMSM